MIQKDLHNRLSFLRGVSPITTTNDAAFVSQIIDMTDLLSLEWVIALGALTDAGGLTTVVLMEHGEVANLSDAAAVPDSELLPSGTGQEAATAFTEANDDVVRAIGYAGTKRYVRLTITPTGNTGNLPIAVVAVGVKRIRGTAGF